MCLPLFYHFTLLAVFIKQKNTALTVSKGSESGNLYVRFLVYRNIYIQVIIIQRSYAQALLRGVTGYDFSFLIEICSSLAS